MAKVGINKKSMTSTKLQCMKITKVSGSQYLAILGPYGYELY